MDLSVGRIQGDKPTLSSIIYVITTFLHFSVNSLPTILSGENFILFIR